MLVFVLLETNKFSNSIWHRHTQTKHTKIIVCWSFKIYIRFDLLGFCGQYFKCIGYIALNCRVTVDVRIWEFIIIIIIYNLIWHHTTKIYTAIEVGAPRILYLDTRWWWVFTSFFGCLDLGKGPSNHSICGWMGLTTNLDVVEKRKISAFSGNRNPILQFLTPFR
jgi:hypothetical protein